MSLGGIRQYGRQVAVVVGQSGKPGSKWTGLRISFNVVKTPSKKPSKGKIQIFNLNETSRGLLEAEDAKVFLFAGYANPDLIFSGDIDEVEHAKDGQDMVSTIEAADGRALYRSGQLFETYDPPLTSTTLLRRLAAAMPIGIGHISSDLDEVNYTQGYAVNGPIRDALDEVTSSIGAEWSIQDEELVVVKIGQGTPARAFLVSPTTGLIGKPAKTKKGIKFTMLLNGQVKPGRVLQLDSRDIKGFFVARKVTFVGDSGNDNNFYCEVEAKERE